MARPEGLEPSSTGLESVMIAATPRTYVFANPYYVASFGIDFTMQQARVGPTTWGISFRNFLFTPTESVRRRKKARSLISPPLSEMS